MKRRSFLKSVGLGGAALAAPAAARTPQSPPPMKITRVRFYHNPGTRPMINQRFHVVTVETDQGITGIGEGGSRDTIEQCAAMIIGEDPSRIEHLWQMMFRGYFYPPGREKIHSLGAIDLALWDIKGKAVLSSVRYSRPHRSWKSVTRSSCAATLPCRAKRKQCSRSTGPGSKTAVRSILLRHRGFW